MLKFVPVWMLVMGIVLIVYALLGNSIEIDSEMLTVVGSVVIVFGTLLLTVKSGYWN